MQKTEEAVPKVVAKALYADVSYEEPTSGLLVTTPLADCRGHRTACAYPIDVVDHSSLKKQIDAMRQPGVAERKPIGP